jgi:hypothetical protein
MMLSQQQLNLMHIHTRTYIMMTLDWPNSSSVTDVQALTASAYSFCPELQSAVPAAAHTTSVTFPLVQDWRPISGDWPALIENNGSWIYFVAQIQSVSLQPKLPFDAANCLVV